MSTCEDCNRPYTSGGFPDLIIPFDAWKQISTTGDDRGLLCPSCICQRLHDKGITCEGAFMSGPIESVSRPVMYALRRVENIELAINGRDNAWSGVRNLVKVLVLSVALGVSVMSVARIGNVYARNLAQAPKHVLSFGTISAQCSCAWSYVANRRQGGFLLQKHRAASRHLAMVEAGTYRPLAEIMDDVLKKVKDG